jgi:phosphoribosylformylglycinamidine synthase
MVRLGATVLPGSDAAVFVVREADKILAAATDCNAIYCKQDPREGARIAVAECCRNLACSGAVPLALTDNLNFGNPHKPENFLQLREAVEGMAEACREFGTPVTGGNVSLYNESPVAAIDPTPTVGVVGLIADAKHITTSSFKKAGDVVLLLGDLGDELGASHYLKVVHGRKAGAPPRLDYRTEISLHNALRALIAKGLVQSAHDCSEGGLAVTLAESCLTGKGEPLGVRVELGSTGLRADVALFNESQSRVVISVAESDVEAALDFLAGEKIPVQKLGRVTDANTLEIKVNDLALTWPLADLDAAWSDTLGRLMES